MKTVLVVALVVFTGGAFGCHLSTESIMKLEEGSEVSLDFSSIAASINIPIEGGVVMNMDIHIGFADLFSGNVDGEIAMRDLRTASGNFTIEQTLNRDIIILLLGMELPAHLSGQIALSSVDTFPTNDRLDSA